MVNLKLRKKGVKTHRAPYSERIFIGVAIMIMIGLLWLKYLPNYPLEIALGISIVIILALLKDYWLPSSRRQFSKKR
jgi:biotin transporter BioY